MYIYFLILIWDLEILHIKHEMSTSSARKPANPVRGLRRYIKVRINHDFDFPHSLKLTSHSIPVLDITQTQLERRL